jgi:hypothetical protein
MTSFLLMVGYSPVVGSGWIVNLGVMGLDGCVRTTAGGGVRG